jgi:hypothetical protein
VRIPCPGCTTRCVSRSGRSKAAPSAALIDSQTVRAAETVGRSSRGFDAGKKANGRKRHILTDTWGWLLSVLVIGAAVQDRDAGYLLMWMLRSVFPTVRVVWADGGYTANSSTTPPPSSA